MSKSRPPNGRVSQPSFLETVAPLMKEYTRKLRLANRVLNAFREDCLAAKETRMEEIKVNPSDNNARQMWHEKVTYLQPMYQQRCTHLRNLVPPTKKLAQHISQTISHMGLVDLEKIELSLRLAELESAISETEQMINLPPPQFFW